MKRLAGLLLLGAAAASAAPAPSTSADAPPAPVFWLSITGAVDPSVARYVAEGLEEALADGAQAAVIVLDTPGGLLDATRDIVQSILNTPLPVVVYVEPRGARATSAGFYIMMAADVAAMAPETHLGAAHPVPLGPRPGAGGPMEAKASSDAAAYARALAEEKGRNARWAEQAVRESASLTAEEALSEKVIDLVAEDEGDLVAQLQGGSIEKGGRTHVLRLDGAPGVDWEMTASQKALHVLANPNLAYVLLMVGIYALLYEFSSPGVGFGGATGLVCLVLAFFSMQVLPLNAAGLALLVAGLVMMAADHAVGGHGFLLSGGALAFGVGSFMLYDRMEPAFRLSVPLILGCLGAAMAFSLVVLKGAWAVKGMRPITGREALVGRLGEVREGGMVFLDGQLWTADGYGPFKPGEKVRVIGLEGNVLRVEKL